MDKQNNEKARLYARIIHANEHVLLERMRAHGFWPYGVPIPEDPQPEAEERKKLDKQIAQLRQRHSIVKDPEKALAAENKRRMEESQKRRAEKKAQRFAEQKKRREAWDARRNISITHLGTGVSGGLQHVFSNIEKLTARNLPVIHNGTELAGQMGISLGVLRWLTFHRRSVTLVHYSRYGIPKKSGGMRYISAPKPSLSRAQHWVQDNILARLDAEPEAHGFIPERSILSNARPHASQAVVLNLDVKDFFPSIGFPRVKGLFEFMGYSEQVAAILALLCTEPPRVAAELDGKVYHVAVGQRVLPQGACTSPSITNALCRRLDRRLAGLAKKLGFNYTRYADDLTFSGSKTGAVGRLLRSVQTIIQAEGFTPHPKKTHVMRKSQRQEVTGLVVNQRPAVSRDEIRTLRAILHNAEKSGLESQNRDHHPDFAAYLQGRIAFISMVDPQRGKKLREALRRATTIR